MNQGLTQLGRQLAQIWKHLGLNQRVSLVLASLLVIGGLAGLAAWSSRSDYTLLYGGLEESEAAKVVAALEESKTPYKSRPGGGILVPTDQVYQIRMQLAGKGIPRGEGVGLEVFDKPNFAQSDFVQRANYVRAIQGELARTISQLTQVEAARVMVVVPENRLLLGINQKPTASVFVKVRGMAELPPSAVNSIRLLVANAVEGLQANNVSVVDHLGNVLSDNQDDSAAGLSNNQLTARRNLEQYLAKKAEGMLERVLGSGRAVVRVAAEINWDTNTRVEEKWDPEGQVIRSDTVDDENVESVTPGASVGAGVPANTAETNGTASATSGTASKTKKKTSTKQFEINRTVSNLMQSAGSLQRLSAAVFVAQRFEGAGAERKAAPRSPEEIQKLRRIVQSALGILENSTTRNDQITLEETEFQDQPVIEMANKLEQQQQRQYWVDLAQRFLFPALAGLALLMFWRSLKRTRAEDVTIGMPLDASLTSTNGHANGNGAHSKNGDNPGVVTVEVLNQLIRENPASMTQAVRSWMVRGAAKE